MHRFLVTLVSLCLIGASGSVLAEPIGELNPARGLSVTGQDYLYDVPLRQRSSHARGGIDTLYWGNVDAGGVAVPGGVWDFEGGPLGNLQGWTSVDLTDLLQTIGVVPVRRVTPGTFGPGDTDCTITAGGSMASVWYGALTAETEPLCWPGGQGYSNSWGLNASKLYTWGGSGDVTIGIDYFVDTETQFDYGYVYVVNSDGGKTPPLNTSVNGRPEDGRGWSGGVQEGTAIGSPPSPAHEDIDVDSSVFSGTINGPEFEIIINFDSDPLYSDGLDSFAGFLNTVYGAMGVDNIAVTGVNLSDTSDFEGGDDDWSFFIDPAIGNELKVEALSNLDPVGDACGCPLSGNVMIATDLVGPFPHPKKQNESMSSPPAYVGGNPTYTGRITQFDIWMDLTTNNGVGYRIAMDYYPWTCPVTLVTGWTIEPLDQGGGFFFNNSIGGQAGCVQIGQDNSVGMPAGLDSIKVVFEILGDCDDFGTVDCTGPQQTNQSPYWDNVRLCSYGSGNAPQLAVDLLYLDVYPQTNSLLPNTTVDIHAQNDNNRADQDKTNANMGDSAVLVAGNEPLTEAYLNFRVYPGPQTNTGDPWFSEYGGNFIAPGGGWAKARMDTAEVGLGSQVVLGSYTSYEWPNGQESMAASFPNGSPDKIIEDGVLTPGSTVEYFFSANFTTTPGDQSFSPDTTNGTYFEFEVLPGYFATGGDILAPCLLYVDAFNAGAQVPIEDRALRNLVGQVADDDGLVHDNWDRYDYFGAGGNTAGPLARESNGDNGMTGYQSMLYKSVLYNTGSLSQEGLRDGDASLLINFLVSDDFNRPSLDKGLWLSGNGMGQILARPGRTVNNQLLGSFAAASVTCNAYRDAGCTTAASGDSSFCVNLTEPGGSAIPQSVPFSARGNGCPNVLDFDVLAEAGSGSGNLQYLDQDGPGTPVTQYASINNDTFGGYGRWGVVIDGFSVHYLRTYGGSMANCGDDSTAVFDRASDVFSYLLVDQSPGTCDPDPLITGVDTDNPSSNPVAFTRLFQNSPNPFNPQTTVRYQLHDQALVKLQIYDVSGKLVRTLVDDVQTLGQYSITWDGTADSGREVSSGVYWARMSTSLGFNSSTKMVVLK